MSIDITFEPQNVNVFGADEGGRVFNFQFFHRDILRRIVIVVRGVRASNGNTNFCCQIERASRLFPRLEFEESRARCLNFKTQRHLCQSPATHRAQ